MTWPTCGADTPLALTLPCLVLCPPTTGGGPPAWYAECREAALGHGLRCILPRPPAPMAAAPKDDVVPAEVSQVRWVADVSAAIRAGCDRRPLLVVALGATAQALPALALAQRAVRHSIVGYVLVDADVPTPTAGADWPAAPVTYVRTPGTPELGWRAADLHGWHCVRGDPVAEVMASAARTTGGWAGRG